MTLWAEIVPPLRAGAKYSYAPGPGADASTAFLVCSAPIVIDGPPEYFGSYEPGPTRASQRGLRTSAAGCAAKLAPLPDGGGVLDEAGHVRNDPTLKNLVIQARSLANAGAQVIAPSGMMDGAVAALREGLDDVGHEAIPILSYAAKYASAFYGPFRDAADSTPSFGDRRGYQQDPANTDEALREVALDLEQGADMIMVKPAMPCLDIVRRVHETFEAPRSTAATSG